MDIKLGQSTHTNVTARRGKYFDGSLALLLESGVVTIATVSEWTGTRPTEGCIWVTDAGLQAALVEAGVLELTGRVSFVGSLVALEARVLV